MTAVTAVPAHTHHRRDARRNRRRLLEAARTVFAEAGRDAALEEVAARAEVSRATLYRNFATREDLIAAVALDGLESIERRAHELRHDDFGAVRLTDYVLELQTDNPCLGVLLSRLPAHHIFIEYATRTWQAFEPLMRRAEELGLLRPGVRPVDVLVALEMTEHVDTMGPAQAGRREAAARIVRSGLYQEAALAGH